MTPLRLRSLTALMILAALLCGTGCATRDEGLGSEIRKTLGVNKNTLEKTENLPEKNYDPEVILKRAEAYFKQDDYIEAAGEYQHFLELHPLHEWADYALYRLGMSYFLQFRTADRDTEPVRKALETFQKLLAVRPEGEYAQEARRRVGASRSILAENQLYVARYYYKKGAYPAAIERLKSLLDQYADLPSAEDGLYYLGLAYYRNGNSGEALSRLEAWQTQYPESEHRAAVKRLVDRIRRTSPP